MARLEGPLAELIDARSIRLDEHAVDRFDAVRRAGEALLEVGAVGELYIDAMIEREASVSTFVGEGFAFPHATRSAAGDVDHDALVVLRFPDGVDWDGERVFVCIGIAARGRGYIGLLSRLATLLLDPRRAAALRSATSPAEVYALLG
ncbi:PTS sugar transporter subunit IIA [Lacisediminihabitans changchengi]|uniref:Mannitol-specific phosphotransferase enzyme IIA component n=1 Tax=Lacisediminihabitans changchengi TaxID=2787634 RepID=A0A934SK49_9MICO|nr:PTS sugar transporter subunit IIA [Lacisediminihabitans changchengi]MBK4346824.1 PTS sugar transporter subunit IIA [Lacisediminihabitans changchengi]MBK4348053.1 PTS sugar transporter subunit IIA [Lacisediminihabitans changchengi]